MLGTAQFGQQYGIANTNGEPSYAEVLKILACAYEGGVNCLDTAANYHESEQVLGRALAELGIAEKMTVVTKIQHLGAAGTMREAHALVVCSVERSLRRLKLESIPIVLFHLQEDFQYAEALYTLKERGLVQHIGCSVSTPDAAAKILKSGLVEAIQIPANVLDHRFRQELLQTGRAVGTMVFVRSIYLQGLILMPEADIPPSLQAVIPHRCRLQEIAKEAGMELKELAARYVLQMDGVTSLVVGVDSVDQLQQNIRLFANGPLEGRVVRVIEETAGTVSEDIILPSNWGL